MSQLALLGGPPVRALPFPAWPVASDADRLAVQDTVTSGQWAYLSRRGVFASRTVEVQEALAAYHGARHALLVCNGSIALELACLAAGIGPGDEVLVPALTFVSTASAIIRAGGIPVFVDVDPKTYCLDPDAVAAAITPRTRAIVPVHLGCCLADMDALPELAHRHGLLLIEDCAHVVGARWKGQGVGSFGAVGCLSFQLTKPLTCGEGGAILTSSDELRDRCYTLLNCGRTPYGENVADLPLGWNLRMGELQAALLLSQFHRLEHWRQVREDNARMLLARLAELPWIESVELDERVTQRQFYYLTLRYRSERLEDIPRDTIIQALNAEGIPTQPAYTPLYREPLFVDLGSQQVRRTPYPGALPSYEGVACPAAERAARHEIINLPHFVLLGAQDDTADIAAAFHKIDRWHTELRNLSQS
jgi:dTDP-4-amino-4,6-dideoxygalactose transaminase